MRYQLFTEEVQQSYKIAILIKPSSFDETALKKYYVDMFAQHGIGKEDIIAYTLEYTNGKVTAKSAKAYIKQLLPVLEQLNIRYVYCADATYFKMLSGENKAEPNLGYEFTIKNTDMLITYGINYSSIKHNPDNLNKLKMSVQTIKSMIDESLVLLGSNIITSAHYPTTVSDIKSALMALHNYPSLTCDIETYSLNITDAGLGTIAFATDKNNGIAFPIDYSTLHKPNLPVRLLVKEFFETYQGNIKYHNGGFDIKILIKELFMTDLLDTKGLLTGIETLTKNIDDTKIIAYLATNSASKPPLSLKYLAQEFAGNYANDDIKDIKKIPLNILLKYNLIDCLSTWFVYDKHMPEVISSNQLDLYTGLMMDSLRLLLQVELTGMPINLKQVAKVKAILTATVENSFKVFNTFPEIQQTVNNLRVDALKKANAKLVKKVHTIDMPAYQNIVFNPNSGAHLQELLYSVMQLPVLALTDTKQPATGNKVIKSLLMHCELSQKPLINALLDYLGVAKILNSFIPAFEKAIDKGHSVHYLHGSFIIGGTVSGRLSSREPNLQNLPSGSTYGSLIKECFQAETGTVFCGADFQSLEDKVNALITGDTNKLKVYIDNYDSHSLRAYYYWKDKLSSIRQITNERTFKVNDIYFTETDIINYQNQTYTGLEFYEKFKINR